ncbi:hypothetical protein MKY34_05380 [Sporosarcina sp. FSL K6-1522]|uniref:hypothetical protein n=1 Tax=Sporosarcina sp. FSL K6-1522 TaxID=2921554 RepID=UPI003159C6A7
MMIDEQASIRSIIEALKTNKAEAVAKEIDGISQKPFLTALKAAGYKYNTKAPLGWHYVGEGVEPLDKSIFDFHVKKSPSPRVHKPITQSNTDIIPSNTQVTGVSHVVHQQFTSDEVGMIKEMLRSWQEASPTIQVQGTLHDRIKQLPQGDKTRKTVVIDKDIGKQLDNFCQAERVNKSDVLHLALMDFLNKEDN